jgi:hypothetical protein
MTPNVAILSVAIDAANSGDIEAAMMYADILRESVTNGFDSTIVYAHTLIMSAVKSHESRAKFAEFDAIASRNADIARENRALSAQYDRCDNCGSQRSKYSRYCVTCGIRQYDRPYRFVNRPARLYGDR